MLSNNINIHKKSKYFQIAFSKNRNENDNKIVYIRNNEMNDKRQLNANFDFQNSRYSRVLPYCDFLLYS